MSHDIDVYKARVLVVDDEPANVFLLEETLKAAGYVDVQSTTDSRQAVAMFSSYRPDMVLLDLMMPEMDGFQVLEQFGIKDPDRTVPVLVLTVLKDRETRLRALDAGATDFVTKPFDIMEVTLRIRNLVMIHLLFRRL